MANARNSLVIREIIGGVGWLCNYNNVANLFIKNVAKMRYNEDVALRSAPRHAVAMSHPWFMTGKAWFLAVVSLIFALGGSALMYDWYLRGRPKYLIPPLAYALVTVLCVPVGYFLGLVIGIDYACSLPAAGNRCGLGAFFAIAPLTASWTILFVDSLILFFAA